jgi:class 3 adenylate cyclase
LYSYILVGKDKTWSPWTKETKKEYTGLYEEKYIFKVKSKNVYGIEGKEASFEFTVLPPWFRTWWAYSLWIALIIFAVFLIIKLNFQRLRNAKHRLERIVKERTKEIQQQKEIIELEKDKSDKLLLNILPAEVADELKQTGKSAAKSFESVTVLFTDIKDFTKISEHQTPEKLVAEIDFCFRAFDDIMQKHGLEKIKTIGDAYMCAGGLPVKNETHTMDVVLAALEIKDFINQLKEERIKTNQSYFEVRIGISTGPVVAGIVGNKKFAYDIWGDTVNTASRMESASEIGKVNISGTTYELIKDKFKCTYRGKIPAKNKGDVDMYFVESLND